MSDDLYSPVKALRHFDRVLALKTGLVAAPVHVQLVLSDLCDQSCHFCAFRDPGNANSELFWEKKAGERNYNPRRLIPLEKVIEILDDCVEIGVKAVLITGGGEPTVHPDFREIAKALAERPLKWAMNTNGIKLISRGYVECLATASWVRVSVDAGSPETYHEVRKAPPEHYFTALKAIREVSALKGPVVGTGYVVTPVNWMEVYPAAVAFREAGANNMRISPQFTGDPEVLADIRSAAQGLCAQAETLSTPQFTVYNRFTEKLHDIDAGSPAYSKCGYQYFTTFIGGDQNCYRCCTRAYQLTGSYGSIRNQRFRDLWMSEARQRNFAGFTPSSCSWCQWNPQNKVLDYLMREDDPAHAEFV